ncbi:MAG: phasin family protein [Alphaproteobacteria bacterium]
MVKVQNLGFGHVGRMRLLHQVRTDIADDLKISDADLNEIAKGGKRTMKAVSDASRTAASGYKDLAAREGKILKRTSQELADALQCAAQTAVGKGSKACADDHKARIEATMQSALSDMRALGETAKDTNRQTFDILSVRMREHIRELKKLSKGS